MPHFSTRGWWMVVGVVATLVVGSTASLVQAQGDAAAAGNQPAAAQPQPATETPKAATGNQPAAQPQPEAPKAAPATAAKNDTVVLSDGTKVEATVKSLSAKNVIVNGKDMGDVKLPYGKVARFELGGPREFFLKPGKMEPEEKIIITSNEAGKLMYRKAEDEKAAPTLLDPAKAFMLQNEKINPEKWNVSAGTYLAVTRGTVRNVNWGLFGQLTRETFWDFAQFRYEFGYTETEVSKTRLVTARNHYAHLLYRYFFSEMWGAFIKDTYTDNRFAGFYFRNVVDLGASFTVYREEFGFLTFDVSANYTVEKLIGDLSSDHAGAKFALDFKHVIESVTYLLNADISLNFKETDAWLAHVRFEVKNDFGGGIGFSLVIEDFYENKPAKNFQCNEFRVTATLGIEFDPS